MWLLLYIHKVTKTCFGRFCRASMIAWQFANYQQKKNAFLLHTILFYCLELGLDTFYCPALLHHYIIGSMPLDIVVFVVFFWNRRSLSQPQITTVRQIMDQVERERENKGYLFSFWHFVSRRTTDVFFYPPKAANCWYVSHDQYVLDTFYFCSPSKNTDEYNKEIQQRQMSSYCCYC